MTNSTPLPRKLAAILYADVQGFSRMTEADEDTTYRRLRDFLDVFTETISSHGGLVMNYAGDAILAMFGSAADALVCAAKTQQIMLDLNKDLPVDSRIIFRIGLNLGDIIEDRNDMFGDGVNIAARLEGIAEPGGICISDSFYYAIGQKLPFDFEFMGEQHVKNISKPIRAYHARLKAGTTLPDITPGRVILPSTASRKVPHNRPAWAIIGIFTTLLLSIFLYFLATTTKEQNKAETRSGVDVTQSNAMPSVAVLPFTNLSNEKEQEYFVDGMTEDLITDLSKISGLFVIARTSVFQYKGVAKDVREIAKALNARYILEGSVRRVHSKVRINTQLIDAKTGNHLWAERYDGDMENIFTLQDQIMQKIIQALRIRLTDKEESYIKRKLTDNVSAYEAFLHGREKFFLLSRDNNPLAREYFEKAIKLDAQFSDAYAMTGWTHAFAFMNGWSLQPEKTLELALEASEKALAINPKLPLAYFVQGLAYREQGYWNKALTSLENAIALDPNYANAHVLLSSLLYYDGRPEEGLARMQKAIRLEPHHPYNYYFHLGQAYYILKQYNRASKTLRDALARNEASERTRVWLAAALYMEGKQSDAAWEVDQVLAENPDFSLERFLRAFPFRKKSDLDHLIKGLHGAGFK